MTVLFEVITATQHNIVKRVFEESAKRKHAVIHWVDPLPSDWKLGLSGTIQKENAAVAKGVIESLKKIGWSISKNHIREGFSLANWPGRFQKTIWRGLPIIVDGAHNPHAANQLSVERDAWPDQESGVIWILGIQTRKDIAGILRKLIKVKDLVWIVPVPEQQSWSKDKILSLCPEYKGQIKEALCVEEILSTLKKQDRWPSPPPVISGSLYLIGDLFKRGILKS